MKNLSMHKALHGGLVDTPCGCVYCVTRKALAKALMEQIDREMMAYAESSRSFHEWLKGVASTDSS